MWLHTIVLTFFFFLISLGFGFFILALASITLIENSRMTRLQFVALGFIIGAPGTGTFLQLLSLISSNLKLDLCVLVLISLFGLLATRNVWRPQSADRNEIALWIALSLPLALMTWWWSFGAFSRFPFGDIGADVHWMKIAQEYADTGFINPYANQSYTDLRSALAGALSGTLGLDLLQFNWVYRYFSILCFMIVFYAVADGIFLDPYRKWFAFFFAAATNVLGLLTNGSAAVAGSFVFLCVLLTTEAKTTPHRTFSASTLLPAGAAFFSILLAFFINNNALMLASLPAISLLFNALNRTGGFTGNIARNAFASVLWSMALIFIHRGSYLFVPIAVAGWLFHIVVSAIASRPAPRLLKSLWVIALLLPFVCICIMIYVVAARFGYLPSINVNRLFSHVTLLLLGRAIRNGDEITLGAGPEIAAIEIGRAIGPLFAVGVGLIFVWWCNRTRPVRLIQLANTPRQSENAARLLWSWTMGCGLCFAVLSGFPFLYRIIFVILGFFAIATTELFNQLLVDPLPNSLRLQRLVTGIAVIAVAALVAGLYAFSWPSNLPYSGYQAMIRPSEIAGVALVLLFGALTFTRSRHMQIVGLAAVIGLGVAIDRAGVSTLFKVYSYGRLPDQAEVVSHYDASDLKADRWLHDNIRRAIVVSDPYTLGMAEAITGSPGIYLFSNLDTMNEATASQIKAIISEIYEPAADAATVARRTCTSVSPLLAGLNQEALAQVTGSGLTQGVLKPVRPEELGPEQAKKENLPPPSLDEILRTVEVLETTQGKWSVVAIINPRTIQWLHLNKGERLSYFPIDEPLNPQILESLNQGPFRVLFSDGQNAVISIDCNKTTMHLNNGAS
ncbi:hypothetical protein [Bradyrhizobium canariense]|uniref:Uncharacterized protein n=1 Tax=Bradyrhizobium canariense TaxID=255045 RepID=A0A1H1M597_9BRAD|nr:hypothetical protein [Bradyrhizobium canariense]SDR81820.1 hypothetical protein SAMN05444158_0093 [Bradyrhizobium canariense]